MYMCSWVNNSIGKQDGDDDEHTGAIVGGVVGGIFAVTFLIMLAVLPFYCIRKWSSGPSMEYMCTVLCVYTYVYVCIYSM